MRFPSPLRYPGGKRPIARYLKLLVALNGIQDGHYVEVYAGGAGVALTLLLDEYVATIYLNDLNHHVHAFWHTVLHETDLICALIQDTPVTVETWYHQKEIYQQPGANSLLEDAFAFFFLNRTNRSGILNGGIIGGYNQKGAYKLDARYNKDGLISRIARIARYKDRIQLFNKDAAAFIREDFGSLPQKALVYFDPPYFVKGKKLYYNHYVPEDHIKIRDLIVKAVPQNWVVSYDNVDEIKDLYQGYRSIEYNLRYSANIKYQGSEIMFFDPKLILPEVTSPSSISTSDLAALLISNQLSSPI